MKKFLDKILNLIYCENIKCISCSDELDDDNEFSLCEKCLERLPFNKTYCQVCGTPINDMGVVCDHCRERKYNFNYSRSVFLYDGEIINLIHNLKYNNAKYLKEPLSNLLLKYFNEHSEFSDVDFVVPVPLSAKRYKWRGYNQSELLLYSFSKNNIEVRTDVIERVRDTECQTDKTREERLKNLEKAFEVKNKLSVKGKNIVVVDDVFTTGTTINECAKALKKAGANKVIGFTLASANFYRNEK